MAIKVVFIGNSLAGDDGIAPFLYKELKDHQKLKDFELLELGVIGLDLISYVEDGDKLIIVDALHSDGEIGKVTVFDEKDLSKDLKVVSQHDFGVEQTAAILRNYKPSLNAIKVIGVNVKDIKSFTDKLSQDIMEKIDEIKERVLDYIILIANDNN